MLECALRDAIGSGDGKSSPGSQNISERRWPAYGRSKAGFARPAQQSEGVMRLRRRQAKAFKLLIYSHFWKCSEIVDHGCLAVPRLLVAPASTPHACELDANFGEINPAIVQ
jgi:hypothetical protein